MIIIRFNRTNKIFYIRITVKNQLKNLLLKRSYKIMIKKVILNKILCNYKKDLEGITDQKLLHINENLIIYKLN